jgi:hypothetical protein
LGYILGYFSQTHLVTLSSIVSQEIPARKKSKKKTFYSTFIHTIRRLLRTFQFNSKSELQQMFFEKKKLLRQRKLVFLPIKVAPVFRGPVEMRQIMFIGSLLQFLTHKNIHNGIEF